MTPDPIEIDGNTVNDVLVDTNAGCANSPELYVDVDEPIKQPIRSVDGIETRGNGQFMVLCRADYLHSQTMHISVANELLQRYVNGPLGSESRSLTWHEREIEGKYSWDRLELYVGREDFGELNQRVYAFVPGRVATWAPMTIEAIEGNGGHEMQSTYFDETLEDVYEKPRYNAETSTPTWLTHYTSK